MSTLTEAAVKKLKIVELKAELTKLGLPTTGKKDELVTRLLERVNISTPTLHDDSELNAELAQLEELSAKEKPARNARIGIAASPQKSNSGGSAAANSPAAAVTASPVTGMPVSANSEKKSTVSVPPVTAQLTEEEKRKARAARFGLPVAENSLLENRAARSKTPVGKSKGVKATPNPKAGTATVNATVSKSAGTRKLSIDPEVLKKRVERWGTVNPEVAKVIVSAEEEEKKRKRAERFSLQTPQKSAEKKQKTNTKMDYRKFLGTYEGKTFKSKKQFFQGTKRDQLQKYIVKTLGGGSLRAAVELPPDTSRDEWLAVNTVDFYNQINLLYGCISEYCTRENCPSMTAGARYEYLWADGKSIPKPIKCTAPEYIEYLLSWVDTQLDDESIFPPSDEFPPQFYTTVKQIFKRLFRFYAHLYHNHLKQLEAVGEDRHLNTCFKHFILFVTEFDLVDSKELQPLSTIVSQILEQNPKTDFMDMTPMTFGTVYVRGPSASVKWI
ncbi:uncharacterized protein SPPG_08582 [Spizellomyces punctatus DAOM BR117]|uniref:SAP domain-containing protein n=1 Tax=Spizellomyces punctatus (strain DAOM BR117) TaxID=645134 RepID=A0A0L0H4T3_SPIPD|nr:uncharacterized protein SPPG_08582 [Spizellomyces punctatus DAOM BR117]KNC95979.1 hypothetical protein SPPG_08582 [Spizellomyces punctatus DAOM BR117]|eukprot:XP_016604019.1 hypothetical protein SPPG_08582 [Spizellomyces punctatus DAOM BR117]